MVEDYRVVEKAAATVIFREWTKGVRHPVRLADAAIVAIEGRPNVVDLRAVVPKLRK